MTGGSSDYVRAGALGAKYCDWGGYGIEGKTWAFDTQRPGWPLPVHRLMAQNHVTAFFHGHDHVFAKEVLDDVVYQGCPHAANSSYGTGFATNVTDYSDTTLVANSGYIRVTVNPADVKVEYVRSKLPTETGNGSVAASYSIQSCAGKDADSDGTNDCIDKCPADPAKVAAGQRGCGVADTDSDGDGTANCNNACPSDPAKVTAGQCGCGVADTDSNHNGKADCVDTRCSAPTLVSNITTGSAKVGTALTWTATTTCSSPKYQFRMKAPRSQVWTTVESYCTNNIYTWSTTGRAAGTYSFQVWTRNSKSKSQYESQATATFTLTK